MIRFSLSSVLMVSDKIDLFAVISTGNARHELLLSKIQWQEVLASTYSAKCRKWQKHQGDTR